MADDLVAKVPPQDLDAEAAVLGAILLLPEAIDQVAQLLKPDHFYRKANGLIYRTLLELNIAGQPIDQVILKGELQGRGLLEDVGGAAYLAELVDAVPTAANAEYYAKVVNEKAILRGLISASAEVQTEAFSSPKTTEEVLDWAERKIFEVTQRRVSTAAVPIGDAIQEVFDHLRTLREGTDQRGIPSGFAYLDDMTHGFHPGELTILAARPSMGKTSLALSFIRNMSIYDGKAVVFFSLEMPRWQVAANLLCNIGKIDSKHLRGGFLRRDDEDRLIDASELLTSARIFIDDAPNLSTMELRAKARRLKAQHDIEAIVIDYLQLMTGSGISREGRQVEVSEISRMLKSLARELSVPVIALAQLSRKVEERPDHKPRMSDLRESGCLAGDSLVTLAGGARAPIRELVGREGFAVRAFDEERGALVDAPVSRAFCTGIKPVFELTLASGRRIRATGNHKFYAEDGWRRLDELRIGERLLAAGDPALLVSPTEAAGALARQKLAGRGERSKSPASERPQSPLRESTGREEDSSASPKPDLLASPSRDASAVPRSPLSRFPLGLAMGPFFEATAGHAPFTVQSTSQWWGGVDHPPELAERRSSPASAGSRGLEKSHDLEVHRPTNERATASTRAGGLPGPTIPLWNCAVKGGGPVVPSSGRRPCPVHRAISQVDVGAGFIPARACRAPFPPASGGSRGLEKGHDLEVHRPTNERATASTRAGINPVPTSTCEVVPRWVVVSSRDGTHRESLGGERRFFQEPERPSGGSTTPGETCAGGNLRGLKTEGAREREPALDRLESCRQTTELPASVGAGVLGVKNPCNHPAAGGSYLRGDAARWDELISIAPAGAAEVFDLTVPGPHSFVANGIVVHNSIEQDADVILLLYRAEYYKPEDESVRGMGQIICAKNRNGPTGEMNVSFERQYTRFDNLAPQKE